MSFDYKTSMLKTLMKRYPDPDTFPYRSWSYSQSFMLWGFVRAYEQTGNQTYRQYVLDYCEKHVSQDGTVEKFTGSNLDDIMPGSLLVWAYVETGEEKYRIACETIRKVYDTYPRTKMGGFLHSKDRPGEMWVDGVFMNLMFLLRYGKYIADQEYCYNEAVYQLDIIYRCCNKDMTGLLYHAYSENPQVSWANPVTGRSSEVWSEGLGWYALVLVETLELLPETHEGYQQVLWQLRKLTEDLAKTQDSKSGLWYQVVDKGKWSRNWHDSSGSSMFLYCISKSVERGWIDRDSYRICLEKGYRGLKTKLWLDPDGCLNLNDACNGVCVLNNYDEYVGYPQMVNAKEAVGACLWALIQE